MSAVDEDVDATRSEEANSLREELLERASRQSSGAVGKEGSEGAKQAAARRRDAIAAWLDQVCG